MLEVLVIGLGYWGPNLVRAMNGTEGARVFAVSDRLQENLDSIMAKYPSIRSDTDYTCLLDQVDAVMVITPPDTHFEIAKECLKAGKHVYIEKPLTPGLDEARELNRLADDLGKVLMVGHIYTYSPAVEAMGKAIGEGIVGDVLYASSTRANMGRFSERADVVWDLLPHDLCVLTSLFDSPVVSVCCNGLFLVTPGVCDVAYTMVKLRNGIICHIHDSWYEPERIRRFAVVGKKGSIVLDEGNGTRLTFLEKGITKTDGVFNYFDGGFAGIEFHEGEPLVLECQHFVDCVIDGRRPKSDAIDGIRVLEVIEAVHRSLSLNGQWVDIESVGWK